MFKVNLPVVKALKKDGKYILQGVSSSTSLDAHKERMSEECLQDMTDQVNMMMLPFKSEHSWRWDDELGTLTRGWFDDPKMYVEIELDADFSKSVDLWKRVNKGKNQIGMSIGGMVVDYHFDEDDTLIYDRIALKEISATSMPANPDTFLDAISKSLDVEQMKATHSVVYSQEGTTQLQEYITRNQKAQDDFLERLGYKSLEDAPDEAFILVKTIGEETKRSFLIRNAEGFIDKHAWLQAWRSHTGCEKSDIPVVREALLLRKPTDISLCTEGNGSSTSLDDNTVVLPITSSVDVEDSDVILNVTHAETQNIIGKVNLTQTLLDSLKESQTMPKDIITKDSEGTPSTEVVAPVTPPVEKPLDTPVETPSVFPEEVPTEVKPDSTTSEGTPPPTDVVQEAPVATPAQETPVEEKPNHGVEATPAVVGEDPAPVDTPQPNTTKGDFVTREEFDTVLGAIEAISKAVLGVKDYSENSIETLKKISEGSVKELIRINEMVPQRKSLATLDSFKTLEKSSVMSDLEKAAGTPTEQSTDKLIQEEMTKNGLDFQQAYKKVKYGA